MRAHDIVCVEFTESTDRNKALALFHVRNVPNWDYVCEGAISTIQVLTSLIGYPLLDKEELGKPGEWNDTYITKVRGYYIVALTHVCWSPDQVKAFKEIIRTLAPLYRWKVEEVRTTVIGCQNSKNPIALR